MSSRDRPKFMDFLVEAGGNGQESAWRKEPLNASAIPIRTEDALSLSVQGKKAIVSRKDGKSEECSTGDEGIRNTDWQGNKIHLSSNGRDLAQCVEEKVAWETRLERKKVK